MFQMARNASAAYASVGMHTDIVEASPVKLIVMLYDGAILALASARGALANGDIAMRGAKISKAIEIINDGLKACLDYQSGGELSNRLGALYDYMCERLLYANLHANGAAIDEVVSLLNELKSAWEEIQQSV